MYPDGDSYCEKPDNLKALIGFDLYTFCIMYFLVRRDRKLLFPIFNIYK